MVDLDLIQQQQKTFKKPEIKYTRRKQIQKKQVRKFNFLIIFSIILGFILFNSFSSTYEYLFIRKIENAQIKIPESSSFLRSSEQYLANDYFLGEESIGNVELSDYLMKKPVYTTPMSRLTSRLQNLASLSPQLTPGIFVWDYTTGQYVDINADQEFPTASIVKLPILLQLFRRAESGLVNFQDEMSLTDYYITEGSGFLQYKPVGTTLPISNLTQLMIQESDNTATNMLLSSIGGVNDLDRVLRLWGFSNTHLSNWLPDLDGTNVATPKDMGTILYNIDNPKFLSLESRAKIVEIMSHVKNRFLIQASLPDNVQFIHKTGDIRSMLGDTGIVMLPDGRKYIVAIMVKRPANSYSAKQFIIDASKIIYDSYVSGDL